MSDSAILVSSHEITESEFFGFFKTVGGDVAPLLRASVSEGDSTVWVGLLYVSDYPELYDESLEAWGCRLDGVPKSVVEMRLNHTKGAHDLYLKISFEFGKFWPVVLVDTDDFENSYDAVREKYIERAGKGTDLL